MAFCSKQHGDEPAGPPCAWLQVDPMDYLDHQYLRRVICQAISVHFKGRRDCLARLVLRQRLSSIADT